MDGRFFFHAAVLFNDHLGGSTRSSPPREDAEQRARAHMPMMDGYRAGDELLKSSVELDLDATSQEAACEEVFRQLNMDERPNGKSERSLSVGDLIALTGTNGDTSIWAVETIGVRRLDPAGEQLALAALETAGH